MAVLNVKERCVVALASLALTLSLFQQAMLGQDPAAKPDAKPAAKARAKPRGRLPAHFAKLVDSDQREKIYQIHDEYAPKVQALQAELQALLAKRDAEVEDVLTDEQKEKLKALKANSKSKRGADAAKEETAEDASESTDATEKAPAAEEKPKASDLKTSTKKSS